MPAPVVQSLDDILASLDPAYSGQEALINQQKAAIPGKYAGQEAGLNVAKENAFRDINRGANSKGLAFSGVPIEQQTRYTGEKYLPALANLKTQQNTEDMSLSTALASLQSDKRLRALSTRNDQSSALTKYLNDQESMRQQQEFDRWKIQNQQQFTASQNALNRGSTKPLSQTQVTASIRQGLESVKGGDGHVAPQDLARAYGDWVGSGLSEATFWKNFQGYWNPKQGDYKKQFNAAK